MRTILCGSWVSMGTSFLGRQKSQCFGFFSRICFVRNDIIKRELSELDTHSISRLQCGEFIYD